MTVKMQNHILKFAGPANLAPYEKFADYWEQFLFTEGKKPNAEFQTETMDPDTKQMRKISFAEKEESMNAALKREILRVAGITNFSDFPTETWASHPTLKWATFAVVGMLIDMILPQTIIDSIGLYSDVRNIGWGDSAAFDIESRDLFVVSKAGRSKRTAQLQKQYNGQVTLIPEIRELSVFVSLQKVLAGKESLAKFVSKAVISLQTAINIDVYNTFATAMAAISNTASTGLRVAGYTQSEFVRLSQTVAAWNGGAKPLAIGTQRALANILPADANYRYDIEGEFVKVGYLKNFQGTDIMVLPQVADMSTPYGLVLSDTTVWIVSPSSNKLVKLVLEGNVLSQTDGPQDKANLTQSSTLLQSWVSGVATNSVAATITL
jgi:hypothetical protein